MGAHAFSLRSIECQVSQGCTMKTYLRIRKEGQTESSEGMEEGGREGGKKEGERRRNRSCACMVVNTWAP